MKVPTNPILGPLRQRSQGPGSCAIQRSTDGAGSRGSKTTASESSSYAIATTFRTRPLFDRGAARIFGSRTSVTDDLPDGTPATVTVRFAGLQGYLLAKLAALLDRQLDKDHYDLVYVLLHHKAGTGPRGAAEALLAGPFRRDLPSLENRFGELASRFSRPNDHGPVAYAKQFTLVYPDADLATLTQDAISAVQEFTRPLIEERQ